MSPRLRRRHMRSTQLARHAGASNGAPKIAVSLSTLPSRSSMRTNVMPDATVAWVGGGEQTRVYVAGARDAQHCPDGGGDPSIFAPVQRLRVHPSPLQTPRPVSRNRACIRRSTDPLAGLWPLRHVARVTKLFLCVEIQLGDRLDVSLNDFPVALLAYGTLLPTHDDDARPGHARRPALLPMRVQVLHRTCADATSARVHGDPCTDSSARSALACTRAAPVQNRWLHPSTNQGGPAETPVSMAFPDLDGVAERSRERT